MLAFLLVAADASAQSKIYRWVDDRGVVHFSDYPPEEAGNGPTETVDLPDLPTSFRPIPSIPGLTAPPENPPETPAAAAPRSEAPAPPPTPVTDDCELLSPIIQNGDDLFAFDDERVPLTRAEADAYRLAIRALEGAWTGRNSGYKCDLRVSTDRRRPVDGRMTVSAEINAEDDFLFDQTISSGGVNRRDLLRIDIRNGALRVNQVYTSLLEGSESVLAFGYKVRVGGVVSEHYWRFEQRGARNLTMERWTYVLGQLSDYDHWDLTRQR